MVDARASFRVGRRVLAMPTCARSFETCPWPLHGASRMDRARVHPGCSVGGYVIAGAARAPPQHCGINIMRHHRAIATMRESIARAPRQVMEAHAFGHGRSSPRGGERPRHAVATRRWGRDGARPLWFERSCTVEFPWRPVVATASVLCGWLSVWTLLTATFSWRCWCWRPGIGYPPLVIIVGPSSHAETRIFRACPLLMFLVRKLSARRATWVAPPPDGSTAACAVPRGGVGVVRQGMSMAFPGFHVATGLAVRPPGDC